MTYHPRRLFSLKLTLVHGTLVGRYDLAGAIGELDLIIAKAANEASYYGASAGGSGGLAAPSDLNSLLILKQLLLALEAEIDAVPLPSLSSSGGGRGGGSGGVSRNGGWLLEILARHSVTCDTAELLVGRCRAFFMNLATANFRLRARYPRVLGRGDEGAVLEQVYQLFDALPRGCCLHRLRFTFLPPPSLPLFFKVRELERCVESLMDGQLVGSGGGSLKLESVVKFLKTVFRGKVPEAVLALADRYRCFLQPHSPRRFGDKGQVPPRSREAGIQ